MTIESVTEKGYYLAVAPDGTVISQHSKPNEAFESMEAWALEHQVAGTYKIIQPEIEVGLVARSFQWVRNPDGTLDGEFPDGDKPPAGGTLTWDSFSLFDLGGGTLEQGTPFSLNVRQFLNGTEAATATIAILHRELSPTVATDEGWSIESAGAGDDLMWDGSSNEWGSFYLTAEDSVGNIVQSERQNWNAEPEVVEAATLIVQDDGNDTTGDGSAGAPYATLPKALAVAAHGDIIEMRKAGGGTWTYTSHVLFTRQGIANNEVTIRVRAGDRVNFYPSGTGLPYVWGFNGASYLIFDASLGQMHVGDRSLWNGNNGGTDNYNHGRNVHGFNGSHHIQFIGGIAEYLHFAGSSGSQGVLWDNTCHTLLFKYCDGRNYGTVQDDGGHFDDGFRVYATGVVTEDCDFSAPFGGHNAGSLFGNACVYRRIRFDNKWGDKTDQSDGSGYRAFAMSQEESTAVMASVAPWGPVLMEECEILNAGWETDLSETTQNANTKIGRKHTIFRYNYLMDNRGFLGDNISSPLPQPVQSYQFNAVEDNRYYNNTWLNCVNWHYVSAGPVDGGGLQPNMQRFYWLDNIVKGGRENTLPGYSFYDKFVFYRNMERCSLQGHPDHWLGTVYDRNMIDSDTYKIVLEGTGGATVTTLAGAKAQWPAVWKAGNTTEVAQFVNEAARTKAGLQLTAGSPGRGESGEKATVTADSAGVNVAVSDAYWIYDPENSARWGNIAYFGEVNDYVAFYSAGGAFKGIRQVQSVDSRTGITLKSSISLITGDKMFPVLRDGTTVVLNKGANQD